MKDKTCCFTGHRDIPCADIEKIKADLHSVIASLIDMGITDFICGGALGFDTLAAEAVLSFKKNNTDIRLILAIPFSAQAESWGSQSKKLYELIKSRADEVNVLTETYFPGCLLRRNRYMIDNSSYCVAYFRKSSGGTFYTVKYGRENGVNFIYI